MKPSSFAFLLATSLPTLGLAGCQTTEGDGYDYGYSGASSGGYSAVTVEEDYYSGPVWDGGVVVRRPPRDGGWDRGPRGDRGWARGPRGDGGWSPPPMERRGPPPQMERRGPPPMERGGPPPQMERRGPPPQVERRVPPPPPPPPPQMERRGPPQMERRGPPHGGPGMPPWRTNGPER